jgi:hypothetical protein
VVITGAMRSSNELGSDGVYNFLTALPAPYSSRKGTKSRRPDDDGYPYSPDLGHHGFWRYGCVHH